LATHWLSAVHAVQALLALQIGAAIAVQSVSVWHATHWPLSVPLLEHTGLAADLVAHAVAGAT
jgi:hypothetical protein